MRKPIDMHRPPANLAAIEAATSAAGCPLALTYGSGALLRALASSKIGGVFLQLGSGAPEVGAWLLDGMDITSRLITLTDESALYPIAMEHLGNDIRVAVHVQDALEFLRDIRAHELHVVVLDRVPDDIEIVQLAVKLMAPGGLLISLRREGESESRVDLYQWLRGEESMQSVEVAGDQSLVLATRRAPVAKPARRGARRMRRRRAAEGLT